MAATLKDSARVLAVEDDAMAAEIVRKLVGKDERLQLLEVVTSAEDAVKRIEELRPDLLLLDANLGQSTGIDVLDSLSYVPPTIFTTASSEYAVEAFKYDVVDYLLKPIKPPRFTKAINRFFKQRQPLATEPPPTPSEPKAGSIFVKVDSQYLRLELAEVHYFEAQRNNVFIKTSGKQLTITSTLGAIEDLVPEADFMRVHRSYLVRLDKVDLVQGAAVVVQGKFVPVSRNKMDDLVARLNILK